MRQTLEAIDSVIDLRTLKPLDGEAILAGARKVGRVIVVHQASRMCGLGARGSLDVLTISAAV